MSRRRDVVGRWSYREGVSDPPPRCPECGYVYAPGEQLPCPSCGARVVAKDLDPATVRQTASFQARQKRPRVQGWLVTVTERTKISGLTRRLTRESLRIDRSLPDKTVKTHHVEERREDGAWEVVHDERIEYPADHTPRSDHAPG